MSSSGSLSSGGFGTRHPDVEASLSGGSSGSTSVGGEETAGAASQSRFGAILEKRRNLTLFEPVSACLNVLMAICVIILCVGPWEKEHAVFNSAMKTAVEVFETPAQDGFLDQQQFADFYTWCRDKLIPGLMTYTTQTLDVPNDPHEDADDDGRLYHYPYGRGFLVGPVRLRQVRVRRRVCDFNSIQRVQLFCHGGVSRNPFQGTTSGDTYVWTQSADRDHWGLVDTYEPGGFIEYLPGNATEAVERISELEADDWLNVETHAVFVNFLVYNADVDIMSSATLLVEQPRSAGIVLSFKFSLYRLFKGHTDYLRFLFAMHIILGIVWAFEVLLLIKDALKVGVAFFLSGWTWVDLALLGGVLSYWVSNSIRLAEEVDVRDLVKRNAFDYVDMSHVLFLQRVEEISLMICVFFVCVRLMRYLTINRRVHMYLVMMGGVFYSLVAFLFLYGFVAVAFAMVAFLMFRHDVEGYSTPYAAFFENLRLVFGDNRFDSWLESSRIYAYTFYTLFTTVISVFMINLVITILSESFSNHEEHGMEEVEREREILKGQWNRMVGAFNRLIGRGRSSRRVTDLPTPPSSPGSPPSS